MNARKFCFIICTNRELLLSECLTYIQELRIPEGYEIDLLTITEAKSMTEGYEEARQASDAKYKIYLHQDTFILNLGFLQNLLDIFEADPAIGMIGAAGYESLSGDGIMWHAKDFCGSTFPKEGIPDESRNTYRYSVTEDGYTLCAQADGFLMATSCDIPWNTEYPGFDFYDASQSMRYLQAGFKIAVPVQRYPWCMHDDGGILNLRHYNANRRLFVREYADYLGMHIEEIRKIFGEKKE